MSAPMPKDAWYAVAHEQEVGREPLQIHVLGEPLVLFRGATGLAALVDRCPHRHAPLSAGRVVGGDLQCPYHGWRFSQSGACTHLPGWEGQADQPRRAATPVPVRVQDGCVWICPGTPPDHEPPALPLDRAARVHTLRWRFRAVCDPVDAIENFLDATHTHFVHPGLVRRDQARRSVPVVVSGLERGVEATYAEPEQDGWIAKLFGGGIVQTYGRYLWPGIAQLGYREADGPERLVITASFVPAGEHVDIVAVVRGRVPGGIPRWLAGWALSPFLKRTVAQDRELLEAVARHRTAHPTANPYVLAPTDLLRPHIDRLLANPARVTPQKPRHTQLEL